MKLKIIPFEEKHLDGFVPRIPQRNFKAWVIGEAMQKDAASGTIVADGITLGFIGYHNRNKNTVEVWTLLGENLNGCNISIVRLVRRSIRELFEAGVGRVQALCNADRPDLCKWLEVLGFEKEGLLRSYGPHGEDRFMYGRVKCSQSY